MKNTARPRLRVVLTELQAGERLLPEQAARYVARVHRLRAGDHFIAFDPEQGTQAHAEVLRVQHREVCVRLTQVEQHQRAEPAPIVLIQALGKGDKPDHVLRDATALGIAKVVFVQTQRSQVLLGERAPARRQRWLRIAAEAARQSGRPDLPDIQGPTDLASALEATDAKLRLCLDPTASLTLDAALQNTETAAGLALLIGPEGGLDASETEGAERLGFVRVRMGRYVLRTETAATAVLGAVVSRFEK